MTGTRWSLTAASMAKMLRRAKRERSIEFWAATLCQIALFALLYVILSELGGL